MNKINLIIGAVGVALLIVIFCLFHRVGTLRDERDKYESNTNVLLSELTTYKTKDSLNVTRIDELRLREDEFNRYMRETSDLVKTLNVRNRELTKALTATTNNDTHIITVVKDSVLYDTLTAKCIDYDDAYIQVHGCATSDTFVGDVSVTDSLYVFETVEYKRFLGFLWKTKKIKNRKFDIMSKNKNTHISGFEVVTID